MLDKIILKELKLKVEKEYKFHPTRKWRMDWAIPSHKICCEEEGAVWTNGRHTRGAGFIGDMEKYNTATSMGWRIIRIVPGDYGKALRFIEEIIKTDKNGKSNNV